MEKVNEKNLKLKKEKKDRYVLQLSNNEICNIRHGFTSAICNSFYVPKEYFIKGDK